MKGTGFDAGTATANIIKFNGADIVRATLGATSKTTHHLLCRSHLTASDAGDLGASVTVDTNFTSGNDESGNCCRSCSNCDRRYK